MSMSIYIYMDLLTISVWTVLQICQAAAFLGHHRASQGIPSEITDSWAQLWLRMESWQSYLDINMVNIWLIYMVNINMVNIWLIYG